jgi:hypothetical protein
MEVHRPVLDPFRPSYLRCAARFPAVQSRCVRMAAEHWDELMENGSYERR